MQAGLTSAVKPKRENFCEWFVQQTANPFFVSIVLVTDQATFSTAGITNSQSQYQWSQKNPQGAIHARYQENFRIIVWVGIMVTI
jgi:hypothetical protein